MTPASIEKIRMKLGRAKVHFEELKKTIEAFLASGPYKVGAKKDEKNHHVYFIESIKETPDEVAVIAGDILQNLRSALDHLAYQLVTDGLGGTPPVNPRGVYFPIVDDASKYSARRNQALSGVSDAVIKAVDLIKPYRGGNDQLWQLHELNNRDKHRLLITVGSAYRSFDVGTYSSHLFKQQLPPGIDFPAMPLFIKPFDRQFPLKKGDVLFVGGVEEGSVPKMQFQFEVAFGEKGVVEDASIIETLQQMIDLVEGIVASF